jgi:hypothetical protein
MSEDDSIEGETLGDRRLRDYRFALGSFVDYFAKVEMAVQWTLQWQTGMEEFTARAVFSGVRAHVAVGHLRRLAEVKKIAAAEWKLLEPVLNQLIAINGVRNLILHYGTSSEKIREGRGLVTDAPRALTLEKMKMHAISSEILLAMTTDLAKIYAHLAVRHMGRDPARFAKNDWWKETLAVPWQYKPPQPAKRDRRRVKRRSKPTSQPDASGL